MASRYEKYRGTRLEHLGWLSRSRRFAATFSSLRREIPGHNGRSELSGNETRRDETRRETKVCKADYCYTMYFQRGIKNGGLRRVYLGCRGTRLLLFVIPSVSRSFRTSYHRYWRRFSARFFLTRLFRPEHFGTFLVSIELYFQLDPCVFLYFRGHSRRNVNKNCFIYWISGSLSLPWLGFFYLRVSLFLS